MNVDTLKTLGYDIVKTSAGIFVVRALNVPDMVGDKLPASAQRLTDGVLYTGAREIVSVAAGEESKLLSGDWMGLMDNIAFFSLLSLGVNESGVGAALVNSVNSVSPLSQDQNLIVAEGAVVTGGTVLANFLDVQTGDNKLFDFVRRPVSTSLQVMNLV